MLEYYRFHENLPHPKPATPIYNKRDSGSGWPEHCPPIRTANAYGWDVINPFDIHFKRDADGAWDVVEAVEVHSDITFDEDKSPVPQLNAWFWEKGQQRPHVISDNVFPHIRHQVKLSTYLYLRTEPGWMLLIKGVPNVPRNYKVMEAVIETDWYVPAHPWHGVLELPRIEESDVDEVIIKEGDPIFRLVPIQRAELDAVEMPVNDFAEHFFQSQAWLMENGKDPDDGDFDITGAYAKQQLHSKFNVKPDDAGS